MDESPVVTEIEPVPAKIKTPRRNRHAVKHFNQLLKWQFSANDGEGPRHQKELFPACWEEEGDQLPFLCGWREGRKEDCWEACKSRVHRGHPRPGEGPGLPICVS